MKECHNDIDEDFVDEYGPDDLESDELLDD